MLTVASPTTFSQSVNFYTSPPMMEPLVELWKSDGTRTGTVRVKDINPAGNSNPANLVNVNGVLYFTANNGTNGESNFGKVMAPMQEQ